MLLSCFLCFALVVIMFRLFVPAKCSTFAIDEKFEGDVISFSGATEGWTKVVGGK